MSNVKLLPLCDGLEEFQPFVRAEIKHYARANVEANTVNLRAEIRDLESCLRVSSSDTEALRAEVARLQEEIDNRWAMGVHTCHSECQRPACVLRRENERLAEALRFLRHRFEPRLDDSERAAIDTLLHPAAAQEGRDE